MARPHATHTRTHRSTVRSCHKTNTLKYGFCYSVAAAASKASGVIQAHSSNSSRQHSKNEKEQEKLNETSLFLRLFLVPTTVVSARIIFELKTPALRNKLEKSKVKQTKNI